MTDNTLQLAQEIQDLRQEIELLKSRYAVHQHDDVDGTNHLRKNIVLDKDQSIVIGTGGIVTDSNATGSVSDIYNFYTTVGPDTGPTIFGNQSPNLQLVMQHLPNNTSLQSFIFGMRKPLVSSWQGTKTSTTLGGNTATISGYNFATNSLAGALINITASDGTFVETQTIASNTATSITISGTWLASTSSADFYIYVPVFFGSADFPWQRLYTQEGTGAGIRFGVGPTAGGQNGLLYMDSTGDLYWRDKAGTSTKLN